MVDKQILELFTNIFYSGYLSRMLKRNIRTFM